VTGAASGIGLATCKMLLEGGAAKVGLLDCQQAQLRAVGEELACTYPGDRVRQLRADVREPDQIARAIKEYGEWAGGLNLVVNCAGVLLDGAVASVSFRGLERYALEHWETTLNTNLKGAFLVAQEAISAMLRDRTPSASGGGSRGLIVTISSISRHGRAGQAAYSASKGALVSLALSLAQELAPYRIRSVALAPGLVDTPMAARIPERYTKEMVSRTAAKRMGSPDEIAHAVRFCIENEFFNGRVLEIDGGAF
jgi:3-oxoacyl-[acyl-carrier protein] reductase